MSDEITVRELKPVNIEGGYVIDGFPYAGLANAIAAESLLTTSQFELVGILDSELFPPISIIRDEIPNFPARIFVNSELKVAVFSSYLTPHESLHREVARTMLEWANEHKCSLIVSSSAVKTSDESPFIIGVASTKSARERLVKSNIPILKNGTVPGIPGILLNEGSVLKSNVIVLLFKGKESGPDFRAGAEICMAMSKLVPGAACDLQTLMKEAENIEQDLKESEREVGPLRDAIYG